MDGRHGATDHHAAQVGAAGGGLALGAPLALQARVQVLVADPQLGDVDEPVARIRALDLRVHVQLAHLDGRLLEDVGQRELEPFGAALERGVGRARAAGQGQAVGLDEITRQPLHAELRVLAAQRPFGTRRPGQAAHGQVGGQLGELAVVQLQPGAAAQAAGHGQRRQPGRPGQRLQIVGLQIELSAPVGGVARVAREQAAIELGPQVQLPRQRLAGRGAQRESVRQPAVARQEFHVAQRQFRRLAQLVLPADDGAMDQQFTLRGQPAQRGMLQPGRGAALVVQVDRHAGDPEAVLRVAAQVQFGLVEPQLQQPRRQGQDAAPGQHRGYLGQGQHGIGRAVMDLDRSQIQPGIEPLPIGLDRADRNLCAQRLAGVGFYLRPPLVDAGQDPIAQAQQPDGGDAITASAPQYRPRSTFSEQTRISGQE